MKYPFHHLRAPFLALLVVLLSACQSLQQPTQTSYSAAEQHQRLASLKYWQAEGKIAFKFADERQNAAFNWQQIDHNFKLHIFGPFGHGSTWLKRTARGVTFENGDLGKHQAATAEELMLTLLGWQVPVSAMQYWIKGEPAPVSDAEITLTPEGFVTEFVQDGWHVTIPSLQQVRAWQLPEKIIATRDDMRLVVVIKQWQIQTRGPFF